MLGGYGAFNARDGAEVYQVLALVATAILVVPVITLGGAAARLAVARRDQRLSALRLAGASLTRIVVSALGVAARVTPRGLSWIRAVVVALALVVWLFVAQELDLADIGGTVVMLAVCFGLMNLVGPFVLGLAGRFAAHRAKDVPRLVAARRLVDDPKSAWRTVSGVAMATFVAGVLSVAPGLARVSGGMGVDHLATDILTGAIVTLVIAAILAAVSSGVTQAGRVLDLRREYRTLHLSGAEVGTLRSVQLREAWLPLRFAVSVATGTAMVMVLPLSGFVGMAVVPGLLLFVGGVAGSLLLVMGAVTLTRGLVDRAALELAG